MSDSYIYISIAAIAITTYLIRAIPLLLLKKPIKNTFFRSFLYYAPYVTLASLTFPAILNSTGSFLPSLAGLIVAVVVSFFNLGLPLTASLSCISALVMILFTL